METKPQSKKPLWGWIISALGIAFLLLDACMKIAKAAASMDGSAKLGLPLNIVQPIGIVLLIFTILYAIPRTLFWGVILLTAYLGGATAIMLRAEQPFYFPVVFCVVIWIGAYLRSEKLQAVIK